MKTTSVFLFFLCSFCFCNAQSWQWALKLGDIKSDKATSIKTDDSGYVYVAGYFSNQLSLGTNARILNYTNNAVSKEIYIAKFDSLGYCYWAKSGGAYFDDRILGMDVDGMGNVVVTGTFWEGNGIDLDGINVSGSGYGFGDQGFVYKLDRNGNVLWGNFVCSDYSDDQGLDVATDKAGNSYVVGFMSGNNLFCGGNIVTANNTNTGNHKHAYWLAKINANGVFQWAKTFGHLPWDASHNKYIERDIAVCVDETNGVYITGGYDSSRLFGNAILTTTGGNDIFVLKYDTAGNYKWATNAGSRKDDWSNGICSDKNGFVYITGEFRDSLIMDTILIKNYDGRDAFVIKIDASTGKPIWGKHAGSNNGGERGNDIVADKNCNIYVCGDMDGGAKFGDNITSTTGKSIEAFVARISTEGKWNWLATGGGLDSTDRANAVTIGKNGQVYTCGFFRSPSTYGGTNLVSVGKSDGFIARLSDGMVNALTPFTLAIPSNPTICKGESVQLFIQPHAFLAYQPSTNVVWNASTNTLVFSPNATTTYTIIALGKAQCPSYDTILFTINIAPDPVADFTINPQQALVSNPVFNLINTSIQADSFSWWYSNTKFSITTNTVFTTPGNIGTYCFTLIATNAQKCKDTITKCGEVLLLQNAFLPNVFTPNNDDLNETFHLRVSNMNLKDITNFKMLITNRMGQEVYKTTDVLQGWNGKYANGTIADVDTYFYLVQYTLPNGKNIIKKGDVSLVR
jgi:gliding motility-associated-like protein